MPARYGKGEKSGKGQPRIDGAAFAWKTRRDAIENGYGPWPPCFSPGCPVESLLGTYVEVSYRDRTEDGFLIAVAIQ